MIKNGGYPRDDVLSAMIDFGRLRLLGQDEIDVSPMTVNNPSDARSRGSGVNRHMQMAFSVPEYVNLGYPSEPLLAEAATQQPSVLS